MQIQSTDVFRGVTSHHGQAFIRIVLLSHLSTFSEAVSLAHLVEAEIVSPYRGILINTGMVIQPRHLHGPWGIGEF